MKIIKAQSAGFCFGVNQAVKTAFSALDQSKETGRLVCTFGPIIHNQQVISDLESRGLRVISDVSEIEAASEGNPSNLDVIVRAHGVSPKVFTEIEATGAHVIDATCPFVRKIHTLVRKEMLAGRKIVIVGDPTHPEVIGINGSCDESAIISDDTETLLDILRKDYEDGLARGVNILYSVVAQTTFSLKKFNIFKEKLQKIFDKVHIFDTICNATSMRQQETIKIASQVDLMVVVGGKESSNTRKLYDISKERCKDVVWVESADEIDRGQILNHFIVGVTAGASTPDRSIEEVIGIMGEIDTNVREESFESMLEESLVTLTNGQLVKGKITKIVDNGVYVDLGFKYEGFISANEFAAISGQAAAECNVGDEIEAEVVKVSDKDCEVILSKRRIESKKYMQLIKDSFANKTPVTVKVRDAVKGGVIAYLGAIRIFIPAALLDERFVKDITKFVGQDIDVVITTLEEGPKGRNRIVGSRKALLVEARKQLDSTFWDEMQAKLESGEKFVGTVKDVAPFGAFVDLGGYDGLIYISELSWNNIKDAKEVVSKGDQVEVRVIAVDRDKKRISLGYKNPEDDPWNAVKDLQVNDILEVTVVRFVKFGVFVNIATGIDGLVPISQISNKRISSAADCLKLGQKVDAKIISIDPETHRVNLSIRDVKAYDPEPKPEELDADGNPIVPEKKERKPRKPKADRKSDKPEEEKIKADKDVALGTSIGDILGDFASQFQDGETK